MAQSENQIGVVGGGLIGLSWASLFSAFGYETIVYDPYLKEQNLAIQTVHNMWASLDLLYEDILDKTEVKFSNTVNDLKSATFIQENCPEDLNLKKETILELEKVVSGNTVIASSTSSFSR